MKKEKKEILIAIGGITLLIGFLGWLSFFWQIGNIEKKFEEIQRVKLESLVWQQKMDQVSRLKKELPQIEEQNKEAGKMFVGKDDAVFLFEALERAAVLAGTSIHIGSVDLTKLKIGKAKAVPKKTEESSDAKAIKNEGSETDQKETQKKEAEESAKMKNMLGLVMEVTGDYASLVDFLKKMEGSPYFVQILIMDVSPAAEKSQTGASQDEILAQGGTPSQSPPVEEGKNLKMNLTVSVFTNETK